MEGQEKEGGGEEEEARTLKQNPFSPKTSADALTYSNPVLKESGLKVCLSVCPKWSNFTIKAQNFSDGNIYLFL